MSKNIVVLCHPFGTIQIDTDKFVQYRVIKEADKHIYLANVLNDKLLYVTEQVTIQCKANNNWLHVGTIRATMWEAFLDVMNNYDVQPKHIHNFVNLLKGK